ncbi:NUDIX domain-containing protein [Metamycoplasma equirhinis]|uniref:Bis(5'-nucleosyl)-tetraphosphatase [asymmetrical] n=1 Tax=Metamycoplasma equirhinis TaxID=92402 RepID=A0ABZ0PB24_9BACT|nr:NUDIX domain-containing protein [Metamycoplasma equirhinis]TPD99462.1 NUDIX domain-containing protein [Metamycoplasma equirhinis]WPB53789.1 NUDIX domain-containing protein [Metamycoplasma equirhinis]
MNKEKSCGAIIFKYINRDLHVLMVKQNLGHWGFPKGHVELNETEKETAIREVKEETNIDIEIIGNFEYVTSYSPYEGTIKDVKYFLAIPLSNYLKKQDTEISNLQWVAIKDALENKITYHNDFLLLSNALNYYEDNYEFLSEIVNKFS